MEFAFFNRRIAPGSASTLLSGRTPDMHPFFVMTTVESWIVADIAAAVALLFAWAWARYLQHNR
jgi:hypothetical protein